MGKKNCRKSFGRSTVDTRKMKTNVLVLCIAICPLGRPLPRPCKRPSPRPRPFLSPYFLSQYSRTSPRAREGSGGSFEVFIQSVFESMSHQKRRGERGDEGQFGKREYVRLFVQIWKAEDGDFRPSERVRLSGFPSTLRLICLPLPHRFPGSNAASVIL